MNPSEFAKEFSLKLGLDKALDIASKCYHSSKLALVDPTLLFGEKYKNANKRIHKTMVFWQNVFANLQKMKDPNLLN